MEIYKEMIDFLYVLYLAMVCCSLFHVLCSNCFYWRYRLCITYLELQPQMHCMTDWLIDIDLLITYLIDQCIHLFL